MGWYTDRYRNTYLIFTGGTYAAKRPGLSVFSCLVIRDSRNIDVGLRQFPPDIVGSGISPFRTHCHQTFSQPDGAIELFHRLSGVRKIRHRPRCSSSQRAPFLQVLARLASLWEAAGTMVPEHD